MAAKDDNRMNWWREARFGMFIHWGLYSVAHGRWKGKPTKEGASYRLNDHRVHYEIGAKRVNNLEDLETELLEIYEDETRKVPDPKNPGQMKYMDVVVEPHPQVVYGDVAPCVDTILNVGFLTINFGGGLGAK